MRSFLSSGKIQRGSGKKGKRVENDFGGQMNRGGVDEM